MEERLPKLATHTRTHICTGRRETMRGIQHLGQCHSQPQLQWTLQRRQGEGDGDQLRSTVHSLHQHHMVASPTQITSLTIGIYK